VERRCAEGDPRPDVDAAPEPHVAGFAAACRRGHFVMTDSAHPIEGSTMDIEHIVDLERYPLGESARAEALTRECAHRFARDGVCLLPGFLRKGALERAADETTAILGKTFYCRNTHNAYLEADSDPDFPSDHPRNRLLRTEVGSIANDYLPPRGVLCRLYAWDLLLRFIEGVTGVPALYRSADSLGALSVNVFEPGGLHEWHFDESRFSITLMLRPAQTGGHFEYVPGVRSEGRSAYDDVARILDGEIEPVRMPFEPGTLSIFAGHCTLHRVTRVGGPHHRLVAVLCYNREPGVANSDEVRKLFWGRAA
jgi:hypothetical protein